MTLPAPKPPNSSLHLKPPLSPSAHQPTPCSPLSPSTTSSLSFRSSSSTYLELGGACIRDHDWPSRVSRASAYRVYDSSSDDEDAYVRIPAKLQPFVRTQVLDILESGDVGVYEEWAVQADDALSLEELQHHAECVTRDIERDVPRRPRPRCMDGLVESEEENVGIENLLRASGQEEEDDDLADIMIGDAEVEEVRGRGNAPDDMVGLVDDRDLLTEIPPRSYGKRGHRRIETLDDGDVPSIMPPIAHGKRGHRRIETLDDGDVPDDIPPLSNGKRGHRRIETLEDVHIPTGIPPLSHGKRAHRRIETLEDGDVPSSIPPLPPGKRGHDRIDVPSQSTRTPQPRGHNRVETLDDVDLYDSPPALKRVETLSDEPLDTPVLNGVQRMRFDDIMRIPIPPALPSPIDGDDGDDGREPFSSDIESNGNIGRIDTLSDHSTPATSPSRLNNNSRVLPPGRVPGPKLSELSNRVTSVTRSLASVQMVSASQAASAEATLSQTTNVTRTEISRLRITLDHLARLTLAQAHATLDAVNSHAHTHRQ